MKTRSLLLCSLISLLGSDLTAQVQPYQLRPGELVFSDTALAGVPAAVRVLGQDGQVRTIIEGGELDYPSGVAIDRDGAILVVNFQSQASIKNGVYRLPPEGGAWQQLNHQGLLMDCFTVTRGAQGQLYVGDGFGGVQEILPDGRVSPFWPGSQKGFPIAFGVALQPDGQLFASESPESNGTEVGAIYSLDAQGQPQTFFQDYRVLRAPQDIALAANGDLMVTHFDQYNPGQESPRLVRLRQNGTAAVLVDGAPLIKPKGIAANARGHLVIADTDAKTLWRWDAQNGLQSLVSDWDDGIADGKPLNRPFDAAFVPEFWIRVNGEPSAGQALEIHIESIQQLGGHPFALFISNQREAYPLAQLWPGSPRTLSLDPSAAQRLMLVMPAGGSPLRVSRQIPPSMAGLALHLQAVEPRKQLPSGAVSFRVN